MIQTALKAFRLLDIVLSAQESGKVIFESKDGAREVLRIL